MLAAKDVQRQITIVAVVAVKEASFLFAVEGIVGGIQVQNNFLRRLRVGFQKHLDQELVNRRRIHHDLGITLLLIGIGAGEFPAIQRALTLKWLATIALLLTVLSLRIALAC